MKHQDIIIRSARTSDHEALCRLWEELDVFHREGRPDLFRRPDSPGREREYIASLIEKSDAALLVAEDPESGDLLGLASLICHAREEIFVHRARRHVEIGNFVVAADQRRRGVGQALVDAAKVQTETWNLRDIELTAYTFNSGALAFYKSMGFETTLEKLTMRVDPKQRLDDDVTTTRTRILENPDCVFCDIVSGKGEASIVFEDDEIIAFMTLRPTRPGEFLIIPKDHIDHFCDIPGELSARMMILAQKFSRRIRDRLTPDRVGMVINGYGVAHAHLIVVPLHEGNDIVSQRHAYLEDGEIKYSEAQIEAPERAVLDRLAALLRD